MTLVCLSPIEKIVWESLTLNMFSIGNFTASQHVIIEDTDRVIPDSQSDDSTAAFSISDVADSDLYHHNWSRHMLQLPYSEQDDDSLNNCVRDCSPSQPSPGPLPCPAPQSDHPQGSDPSRICNCPIHIFTALLSSLSRSLHDIKDEVVRLELAFDALSENIRNYKCVGPTLVTPPDGQ